MAAIIVYTVSALSALERMTHSALFTHRYTCSLSMIYAGKQKKSKVDNGHDGDIIYNDAGEGRETTFTCIWNALMCFWHN